jgi:hypothetical protein
MWSKPHAIYPLYGRSMTVDNLWLKIRTYALPLYLVGVIREPPLPFGLDKAIFVSPKNIKDNTGMLRPYPLINNTDYLWFIQ